MPVVKKSSKIVRHCFQKGLSTQGAYNFNLDLKPGQNPAGADVCLTGKNLFASKWVEIFSDTPTFSQRNSSIVSLLQNHIL